MPTEQAEVEELLSGKSDLTYTVAIEVVPSIALADFKTFQVEKPVADVSDTDVDEAIKRIADTNRGYAAKAEGAKAESGDRVTINFKGTINGEAFEGGTGEGIQVVIGSNTFIPGFEEQLIGIGANETRTLKVAFPKNYMNEKLAGQPAEFETTATLIEAPQDRRDRRRVRQDAWSGIAGQAQGSRARASGCRVRRCDAPARQARAARPSRRGASLRGAALARRRGVQSDVELGQGRDGLRRQDLRRRGHH